MTSPSPHHGFGPSSPGVRRIRAAFVNGFLGAGKTQCIAQLGREAAKHSLRVGVITNDHGFELADTTSLTRHRFAMGEVKGGALIDRTTAFAEAATSLVHDKGADFIIAEPVGSSVNLSAAVDALRTALPAASFSPLSVVVDPVHLSRFLGLDSVTPFSTGLAYLFRKQLEEADIIVINKVETLSPPALQSLVTGLKALFPHAVVFSVSARDGRGVSEWFECLVSKDAAGSRALQLDPEQLALAESRVSWLNCNVHLSSLRYWDSGRLLTELATAVQLGARAENAEIAHLKMALVPDEDPDLLATVSLVRNDAVPELGSELEEPIQSGQLLINLRAETDPETLHEIANRALLAVVDRSPSLFARMEHCEHFRPGASPRLN